MLRLVTRRVPLHPQQAVDGFTLIELMVVLVVLGILAAIALPSYAEFVRKGRRSDAVAALTQIQQSEERWRANNSQYTTDLGQLRATATTASGYYTVVVSQADATSFKVTATTAGIQVSDTRCASLTLTQSTGATTYTSMDSSGNVDSTGNNRCWNR